MDDWIVVKDIREKREGDYVIADSCMNCGERICFSIKRSFPFAKVYKEDIICKKCGCNIKNG